MNVKNRQPGLVVVLFCALVLSACVQYQSRDGVKNSWRELPLDAIQKGVTTSADILDWLGPPSQMIALNDETVFYYLSQEKTGTAKVLIVWNHSKDTTIYDRAVFFFNQEGILTEFSFSDETAGNND